MDRLQELQAYCDERARRWAVSAERAKDPMTKMVAQSQMHEAKAIGQQVAALIKRGQG